MAKSQRQKLLSTTTMSSEGLTITNDHDDELSFGFDRKTGIYHSLYQHKIPNNLDLDTATYVLSQFPSPTDSDTRIALIDSITDRKLTYSQLKSSINKLATGLQHALGVKKGDVVFVLSPNCLLYPVVCISILSIGAVLTTANPMNTASEIAKQVQDSCTKLAIAASDEVSKLIPTGVPTLLMSRMKNDKYGNDYLSIDELIECCEPLEISPEQRPTRDDTAAILYSSGTTGASKGVVLTHSNLVSIITLLKWMLNVTSSANDVFLCFIPMFHIYGLAFFALGLFSSGVTSVIMQKFDFIEMLEAIQRYKINNIPAVPPVILGLVKYEDKNGYDLSSLCKVGSGAAPLSKELTEGFREKFKKVELRQGYGLTESSGAATFFITDEAAVSHSGSSGQLLPSFKAMVVDVETGKPQPPYKEGEVLLKSPAVMKGYFGNNEATAATIDSEGWLHTGDLGYFDEDGCLYIVDRIKELIKHNGYQVAPAELEAILLTHPHILDAAVVPVEDQKAGQIPKAYVVKTTDSTLTEDQVIEFVANQVAPYKKIRKVSFIKAIPKSAAGKILRKELITKEKQKQLNSKL